MASLFRFSTMVMRALTKLASLSAAVVARGPSVGTRATLVARGPSAGTRAALGSSSSLFVRGGSSTSSTKEATQQKKANMKHSDPAPGTPFHYAFPVHDLELARHFYGTVLGCQEGRSSDKWQDYSLHGHQIVCHWAGDDYRCIDYYNPVDGDEVPVPHMGLALTVEQFHALTAQLKRAGVHFIIEPHLRFKDMPGEQWTCFFKDPSNNNLEFKAMTNIDNLFAKYNVED